MTSQATNQIVTTIGRNVAFAREVRGLTQRQVAIELGVDTRAINRWERAGIVPSPANLTALARLFGRDPGWFYSRHDEVAYGKAAA